MVLQDLIKKLFHTLTISELQLMNKNYYDGNISYNSLLYIDLIYHHQGKYTASKIADDLCVSKPAVIMKINELIKKGYIYKQQDPNDKRNHYLFVNKQIIDEYKIYRTMDDKVARYLEEKYSAEELDKFKTIFDDMCERYIEVSKENERRS